MDKLKKARAPLFFYTGLLILANVAFVGISAILYRQMTWFGAGVMLAATLAGLALHLVGRLLRRL